MGIFLKNIDIVIKLLDAGATVIGTTRYPRKASKIYEKYDKYNEWKNRLIIYHENFDLDTRQLDKKISKLYKFIDVNFGCLDVFINCAAQTIRVREKKKYNYVSDKNRYNDPKFVKNNYINSWNMRLGDFNQKEMEEVYRINAVAPTLMFKSKVSPYIINVHAREGLFEVGKGSSHLHTNMAKSGLGMLTKCIANENYKTLEGEKIKIHGCDPGWISIDEYYEKNRPWIIPPLDEIDGASRILFPLFGSLKSCQKTRRHFVKFTY